MEELKNLLTCIPADLSSEVLQTLLREPNFQIERIVSLGHVSAEDFWYDQEWNEWVLLLAGSARLRFEGEAPIELQPGSYLNIPAQAASSRVD